MAASSFQNAIEAAEHLALKPGLKAIKKAEGGGKIRASDNKKILGSVAVDDDCELAYPNDHRWDYVIGYAGDKSETAYFVEVHSAETSEVSVVEGKLKWLRQYLAKPEQSKLASLNREIHWVASGRINIPSHTPQYKKISTTLRKLGLHSPPVKTLNLT